VGFGVEGVGSEFFDEPFSLVLVVEREGGREIYSIDISRFDAQDGDDFDGGGHVAVSGWVGGRRVRVGWISKLLISIHPFWR
jgi:hypothetical protein